MQVVSSLMAALGLLATATVMAMPSANPGFLPRPHVAMADAMLGSRGAGMATNESKRGLLSGWKDKRHAKKEKKANERSADCYQQ